MRRPLRPAVPPAVGVAQVPAVDLGRCDTGCGRRARIQVAREVTLLDDTGGRLVVGPTRVLDLVLCTGHHQRHDEALRASGWRIAATDTRALDEGGRR